MVSRWVENLLLLFNIDARNRHNNVRLWWLKQAPETVSHRPMALRHQIDCWMDRFQNHSDNIRFQRMRTNSVNVNFHDKTVKREEWSHHRADPFVFVRSMRAPHSIVSRMVHRESYLNDADKNWLNLGNCIEWSQHKLFYEHKYPLNIQRCQAVCLCADFRHSAMCLHRRCHATNSRIVQSQKEEKL